MARRTTPAAPSPPNPLRVRPLPRWSAVLAPVIANAFQDLRISVALFTKEEGVPEEWYPIHNAPSVTSFEFAAGTVSKRYPYNYRCFDEVRRTRERVLGRHAGFYDLFVPVGGEGKPWGILAAGPFARSRPTSAELQERWHVLTGARGRLADASFHDYVSSTLSTLTLEGPLFPAFERLMLCFARLVGGQGDPAALAAEAAVLRIRLIEARFAERMWEAARAMLDERTSRTWPQHSHATLALLGMKQVPRHVAVGLLLGRSDDIDLVDDLLRRDAFQRACVGLARKQGRVAFERIGDHGVALLLDHAGSASSARARLVDLSSQVAALARRFGLRIYTGIGPMGDAMFLPARYDAALAAAERALSQGKTLVHADPRPERRARQIRQLRRELGQSAGSHPSLLSPRFDRYVEAALVHCGYRYEPVRAELAAGIERLAEPLLATGALDEKSFEDMCAAIDNPTESAPTVSALVGRYKALVSDLESALEQPSAAGRDRGVRRAIAFLREHASEPLSLTQAARVAGFAPGYFSKLFKRDEGTTFEHYLQGLRIERAKQMLLTTSLSVERVRQLAGFRTRSYFNRAFKRSVGATPVAYRRRRTGSARA